MAFLAAEHESAFPSAFMSATTVPCTGSSSLIGEPGAGRNPPRPSPISAYTIGSSSCVATMSGLSSPVRSPWRDKSGAVVDGDRRTGGER